jgi:hypothetical protein
MANNFDTQGKNVKVVIPIMCANGTDSVLKAAFNGVGYAYVSEAMNIDHAVLSLAMSAGVNAAGSGSTKVGLYNNNTGVSFHTAAFEVTYASSKPYAILDRADFTTQELAAGDCIRVDLLAVPAGAATSYAQSAQVILTGQSIG